MNVTAHWRATWWLAWDLYLSEGMADEITLYVKVTPPDGLRLPVDRLATIARHLETAVQNALATATIGMDPPMDTYISTDIRHRQSSGE